jgi:hypothetical protein
MKMRPARADALLFDGKEITEFLDEYNRQADNAGLTSVQKLHLLPDYCDSTRRTFVKKMKSYVDVKWDQLQEDMKEHWRDNDTAQRRGTRAYLEAYVRQSSQSFPGISDYYTNFLVISDAGIASKQVHEAERGFLFFKGLPRTDKELVLFSMPEPRPDGVDVATYDMDDIYKYVRKVYRQREGIKQTSYSQAEEDARRAQLAVQESRSIGAEEIQTAVQDLKELQNKAKISTLPPGVDQEVQDLIDAMKGAKISAVEVESLSRHPSLGALLRDGRNYVYFLSQVTNWGTSANAEAQHEGSSQETARQPKILSRNDGSFITDQPRNIDPQAGTIVYKGREMRQSCNMCGSLEHLMRNCPDYLDLIAMGWISFTYDRDTRYTTWYFGPTHKRFREVGGRPPPTYKLDWIIGKIQEFFEVTVDVLKKPASVCKPELFGGLDSRPAVHQAQKNSTPMKTVNSGQGNTVTIKRKGRDDPAAEVSLAEFQTGRILGVEDDEVIALDHIDVKDIVLSRSAEANTISSANAATRERDGEESRTDKVLDRVRHGQLQKKKGRPRKSFDASRVSRQDLEDSVHPTPGASMEDDELGMDDAQNIPYPSQLHDHPFAVVKPPSQTSDFRNLSADPDNLQPARKKKVQIEGLDDDDLRAMLQLRPNRIPTAMLKQEVRGVTIADLLGQPSIRKFVEGLFDEEPIRGSEANTVSVLTSNIVECEETGQSAVGRFLKRNLPGADWPDPLITPPSTSQPTPDTELALCRYVAPPFPLKNDTQLSGEVALSAFSLEEDEFPYEEVNTLAETHLVGQTRHRTTGTWDTWNDTLDNITHRDHNDMQRAKGLALVQNELPTCWATVGVGAIRCLIDTGAQMNLLRRTAALALRLPYEQNDMSRQKDGVISANGSMDPFVGTAWNIPVKIGQVTIMTHFRIIENLTRSAILGAPWCSAARLSLQYNVFGRVTCRILDSTGNKNVIFIASDPAPGHPRQMEAVDDEEDSEN